MHVRILTLPTASCLTRVGLLLFVAMSDPSSVLSAQKKLGALVIQQQSKRNALFLVFHGRIKTSQVFICDASVVGAIPMVLFAGTMGTMDDDDNDDADDDDANDEEHEDSIEIASDTSVSEAILAGGATPATLEIDGWLRFSTSAPQVQLFVGLRRCIAALLQSKLGAADHALEESAAKKIVAAVASIVKDSDCGAGAFEKAQPLPKGWKSIEDPSSATGRVFFKNLLTGATQRERPTRAATAASSAANAAGARLPPPTLVTPPAQKPLTDEEKREKAEKAERLAAARAEAKAQQAEAAEQEAAKARLAALRLVAEADERARQGDAKDGVRVVTVTALLGKLDLEHYAEGFANAGIDDDTLAEVIAIVNDDSEEGAVEVDKLIADAGVRGGAAVKVRRALSKQAAGGDGEGGRGTGSGGGGKGRGGGRGGGGGGGRGGGNKKLSKKEQAAQKKEEAAAAKKLEKQRAAQKAALLQASKGHTASGAGSSGKAKSSRAAAAKEKTCAELSDDDNPKVVARVVGQALKLQLPDSALPKDVLELARQKMPDVDLTGLAPKPALLALAKAIVAASSK
jgi:hypothetical protein